MTINEKSQIIWAIDPTQKDHNLPQAIQLVRQWSEKLNASVQPVSVFSRTLFNFPVEYSFQGLEQLEETAQKLTSKFLSDMKATDFLPPKLLYISSNSHRQAALTMADQALQSKAQLIIVNSGITPQWHLFSRLGFTETLITTSKVPVLAINPQTRVSETTKTVLFPTDFSAESKAALLTIQAWLKQHDTSVIIYNQIETPNLNFTVFEGGWMNLNVEELIAEIETNRSRIANTWKTLLENLGIKTTILIERQHKSLEADILACANQHHADLIVLVNHAGTLRQTILGSAAREVLSRSMCPVLIFHEPLVEVHEKSILREDLRQDLQ